MGGRPLEWKSEIPDRREEGQTGLSYLRSGRPLFPTGGARAPGLPYSESSSLVSFRLSRKVSSRRSSSSKGARRREAMWQMRTRARAS